MAIQEWFDNNSTEYEKVLLFNNPDVSPFLEATETEIDCVLYEAYAYTLKKTNEIVIGIVPKVMFATNMVSNPAIAGEYLINQIKVHDAENDRYLVEHRQYTSLDFLNHIIDLNRPDVLAPQTIYDNTSGFKGIAKQWAELKLISPQQLRSILALPDNRPDLIDENIINQVENMPLFKSLVFGWQDKHFVSEKQAREYAKSKKPLKTLDDELSFKTKVNF